MSIEIKPLGHACNLSCGYCYQEPMRLGQDKIMPLDTDTIIKHLDHLDQDFSLFGGEPLLTPKHHLKKFFKFGFFKYQKNSIQTNGILIDGDHIQMFKDYNVNVGVSIDGPHELNALRTVRGKEDSPETTIQATDLIMKNIQKMVSEGINVTVIITLHKRNGIAERLPRLISFIRWLSDNGVMSGNVHSLEVDSTMRDAQKEVLSEEENIHAMLVLAKFFEDNPHLTYDPFRTMRKAMLGDDAEANCIWNNCDVMNTSAVYGIEADGGISNCGRTNKEGINWHKADDSGYERYISLYNTPQEIGGCKECPYFMFCGGGCPGESKDGDFRNKTMYCSTHKSIYAFYEEQIENNGGTSFVKRPERLQIEETMMNSFLKSSRLTVTDAAKIVKRASVRTKKVNNQVFVVPVYQEEENILI